MLGLPTTTDDRLRLSALAQYEILDSPTEALFDAFARLAQTFCGTPIALISLIDENRQWFKSNIGLPGVTETPRAYAFCDWTINQTDVMEVPDAELDPRFADNPLVTGEPQIRFYAGAPLIAPGGHALGTVCVIDRQPRRLTVEQREALSGIAAAIVEQFEARRVMQEEQRRASARVHLLSSALEVTEDAVSISTLASSPLVPATMLYANDAFLKLKGATSDQVIGKSAEIFFGALTDRSIIEGMRRQMHAGRPCRVDYVSYRLDGSHYYASCAAHPLIGANGETSMVTIQRDVTHLVLRDVTLAMQNERLTTLTSIAREIFAALDPRALVEALIAGARELVGAEAHLLAALPGGGFATIEELPVPENARPSGDAFVARASSGDGPLLSDDEMRAALPIPGPTGQTRYLLDVCTVVPLHTADIFALGLLGQYFAVAARNVELYGELQARRAAVVELNQVKNDLITMLAHDFKGPLTTIVGFADVLAEDDRFDDESRKFLSMISSSAMRLASLATDTLALSRLEQNELTLNIDEFDLVALVRDIVRVFSVTRHIELKADRAEMIVAGDSARLRQVFENLIGNAIKYSPRGESVDVRLRKKERGVDVAISDRGIGVPAGDRAKLFGRFARAHNARAMGIGGTGFGLYLTKTIVEMHGGTIGVESTEGSGSTFTVFVPATVAATRTQNRRFVLLDSAGDTKSYVAHTLREDGFATTVVGDGAALLDQVDEVQFDAALIDTERVGMPLDEFVRRVAGRTALIRIDASAVEEGGGWDGYLVRPFLTKDFYTAIDAAIALHPKRKPAPKLSFSTAAGNA